MNLFMVTDIKFDSLLLCCLVKNNSPTIIRIKQMIILNVQWHKMKLNEKRVENEFVHRVKISE